MKILSLGIDSVQSENYSVKRQISGGQFMLILLKSSCIFTIDDAPQLAEEGSVIIYDSSVQQIYHADGNILIYDWIVFDIEGDSDFSDFIELPLNTLIRHADAEYLSGIIRNIASEFYSTNQRRGKIMDMLMKTMLINLSESNHVWKPVQQNKDPHYNVLQELREKIYRNPQMKWNVDSMAAEVNMSRSYFQHIYREMFGVSCISDVISGKIEKAKEFLSETSFTVSQISVMCGYDNEEHFMRQFKKIVGVTPTKYRRK